MVSPRSFIKGKTILITGGTGSFGRAFARLLLEEYKPAKVIIFSRDEWKQWEMQRSDSVFDDSRIRYFIGDVRDKERLLMAFRGVDIVVHAAALKQVPAAEYNPSEFIKTNVLGAMNIIDAAVERGVGSVIALSTDKAVNPINLYGATKLCSDKLFVAGNVYSGESASPKIAVVRYGNVLGSRGSIIPLWKQMLAGGAKSLPVTDDRMTRFWITIEQAAQFVIHSLVKMAGGEIFIPKIPSMKISDLLEAVAPGVEREICGIREGEKLHEIMVTEEDSMYTLDCPECYVIMPRNIAKIHNYDVKKQKKKFGGKFLPEGFTYASNINKDWLTVDQLRDIVANI